MRQGSGRGSTKETRDKKDLSTKGPQGVGEHSKGFREGPRRTLRFPTNGHSIIELIRFLWRNVLFC